MKFLRPAALLLFLLDTAGWTVLFLIVAWWRVPHLLNQESYFFLLLPLGALWLCIYLIDGYRQQTDMMSLTYTSEHFISIAAACLLTLFVSFTVVSEEFPLVTSRGVILASFLAFAPVSLVYRRAIYYRQLQSQRDRLVLFLGPPDACYSFNETYRRLDSRKRVMFASREAPEKPVGELQIFPLTPRLFAEHEQSIDCVITVDAGDYTEEVLEEMIRLRFNSIPIYTLESFYESQLRRIPIESIDSRWLLKQGFELASVPVFARLKRLSDIALSCVFLVAFFPLFLLAALAIRIENTGPVFFRQRRLGQNLHPFTITKFRTLQPPPDPTGKPPAAELRATRVGKLLRRWRIDELPQLWNVLKGDMSLIGPRAEWDRLAFEYQRQLPFYNFRLLVKPGITGWAQVNLPHGSGREHTLEKLEYDFYYIRHFSFLLDASIILKTLQTMMAAQGE